MQKISVLKGDCCLAHCAAVAAAAFFAIIFGFSRSAFDHTFASSDSLFLKVVHLFEEAGMLFLLLSIICFVTTALPFYVAFFLAKKFQIDRASFFVLGGIMTGLVFCLLFSSIPHIGFNQDTGLDPSLAEKLCTSLPVFCVSGFAAGIVAAFTLMKTCHSDSSVPIREK